MSYNITYQLYKILNGEKLYVSTRAPLIRAQNGVTPFVSNFVTWHCIDVLISPRIASY